MTSPSLPQTVREPVAIVGIAVRLPDADSLPNLAANLDAGRDSVRHVPADRLALAAADPAGAHQPLAALRGIEEFDHEFFKISLREAQFMAPEQRLALQLACAAAENAGIPLGALRGSSTGVVIGAGPSDYPDLVPDGADDLSKLLGTGTPSLCGRIAYLLGCCGPTLALDTGCSAGLVALDHAASLLRNGDCEQVLVGGVSVHSTFEADGNHDRFAEVMATGGRSRAFDADADGAGDGEGGVMLVLRLQSAAVRDGDHIWASVLGTAVNHNGDRSNGLSAPSAAAQGELIATAWARAGLRAAQADYIEAHGSGTRLGDMIEIDGLRRAMGEPAAQRVPVGSIKTNIGHLDRAAGLAGLAKVIAQLQDETIYPSLHFEAPSQLIDFANAPVEVVTISTPWPATEPRYAGVSSFSMTGSNAHAVLAGAPVVPAPAPYDARGIATVSARSTSALRRYCTALADDLDGTSADLGDVLRVLNLGRDHLPFRVGIAVDSMDGLVAGLRSAAEAGVSRDDVPAPTRRVVWTCGDDGTERPVDAAATAESWPAYADALAECTAAPPAGVASTDLDWFAARYAAARLSTSLGLPIAHAIGTGRGALVAMVVNGDLALDAALGRLAAGNLPAEAAPPVPMWLTFELLAVIGTSGNVAPFEAPAGHVAVPWSGEQVLEALAALHQSGVDLDWTAQHADRPRRVVALPTYPFEPTRVWITDQFPAPVGRLTVGVVGVEGIGAADDTCSLESVEVPATLEDTPLTVEGYQDVVRTVWGDTLGSSGLSATDNYFDLGGTSAMALQMLTAVRRQFGVRLKLIDLYEARTVGEFAQRIADLHGAVLIRAQAT